MKYEKRFLTVLLMAAVAIGTGVASELSKGDLAIVFAIIDAVASIIYMYQFYAGCANISRPRDAELAKLWKSLFVLYVVRIFLPLVSGIIAQSAKNSKDTVFVILVVTALAMAFPIIVSLREVQYLKEMHHLLKGEVKTSEQ